MSYKPTQAERASRVAGLSERSLIATLLDSESSAKVLALVLSEVDARDFGDKSLGLVFSAAVDLHRRGEAVDGITVAQRMNELGTLYDAKVNVGGVDCDGQFAIDAMKAYALPSPSSAVSHARMIRKSAILHRLMAELAYATSEANAGAVDPTLLLSDLAAYIQQEQAQLTSAPMTLHDGMQRLAEHYATQKASPRATIKTGIPCIDKSTRAGGLYPGWLVLLAARPGIGKSSVAAQIAGNVGLDTPVLFVQAELASWQTTERIGSGMLGRPLDRLWEEAPHLWNDVAATVDASRVRVIGDKAQTLDAIIGAAHRQHATEGLGMVVIDQLSKIVRVGRDEHKMREHEWFGHVSAQLRQLAVDLQVTVLLLHQINRTSKQDRRPAMHHLKGCGKLEEDADFIVLLHRDSAAEASSRDNTEAATGGETLLPHECWIAVAKNRMGPTSESVMDFNVDVGCLSERRLAQRQSDRDRTEPRRTWTPKTDYSGPDDNDIPY